MYPGNITLLKIDFNQNTFIFRKNNTKTISQNSVLSGTSYPIILPWYQQLCNTWSPT